MHSKNYKIEYININNLKPATYNPRVHDKDMLRRLEESIKEFDLVDPVIANRNPERINILIGGHARYKVAKKLGYKTIPVVYVDLPLKQEQKLNVKLNKISGEWDFSKLVDLFDQEFLLDMGFEEKELQSYWDSILESENDNFNVDEELKKIHNPTTQRGDLIILGDHKLLCASSTDKGAVLALFGDDRSSFFYSDPPFNINLNYDKGVGNKSNYGGSVDDNKTAEGYKEFLRNVLENALAVSTPDTHYFMFADEAWVWVSQTLYNELGIKNRRLNIWLKNNSSPTPAVAFNKAAEFVVYGTTGRPYLSDNLTNLNEVMNKEAGSGNQLLEDLNNIWAVKRLPGKSYSHPTEKPPELHQKAIQRCSQRGDIIFDAFSGSASTMVCAEQLGRRVYSLEISEVFCDLAIRRYEKMTGKKAKVIKNYYEEK